jgi:KDO2-lipid IV(A) lauroyltransferase
VTSLILLHSIEAWLLNTLCNGLACLSLPTRRRLGRAIGAIITLVPTRDRAIAELQLKKVAKLSPRIAVQVYQHLACVFLEALETQALLKDPRHVDLEPIRQFMATTRKTGVIALSAHIGNWELLAGAARHCNVPLLVVAREARRASWQSLLASIRARQEVDVVWRSDTAGVKRILKTLSGGGIVAALIDQDTDVRSRDARFFGLSASTPVSLIELAVQRSIPCVAAFCYQDAHNMYRFRVKELSFSQSEGDPVAQVLEQYHHSLESLILEFPDQWAWVHKRWRTLPGGERLSSRQYRAYLEKLP